MEDYSSNADKLKKTAKSDRPKPEKVVTGEVVTKPQGIGKRMKGIFLGGDFQTAREYLISEVLLPATRNLIVDTVSKGIDRLVYGETSRRRSPTNYASRIQYSNPIYRDPRTRSALPGQNPTGWSTNRDPQDDIIVQSRSDADAVVDQMIAIVDQYDVVSLADLKELLGLPSSHVDNKRGWTHMTNIQVSQVREGYKISFPPLEDIA
jgi:hypothetical protein